MALFVGAGLSMGQGLYPSWPGLVNALNNQLSVPKHITNDLDIAQYVKDHDAQGYEDVIRRYFAGWKPTMQKAVSVMAALPTRLILTPNYDDALSEAFHARAPERVVLDDLRVTDLEGTGLQIFHIHGFINTQSNDPLRIVLTRKDFEHYYQEAKTVEILLHNFFLSRHVVFFGFSFNDQYVVEVLSRVAEYERRLPEKPQSPYPRRFACLPLPRTTTKINDKLDLKRVAEMENRMTQLGVIPIWYDPEHDHQELVELIREWSAGVRARPSAAYERSDGAIGGGHGGSIRGGRS
ncbi:SIR2 family protein [Deinococcus oregonensis]|uniref:SIR2 family protein n=1 Tax=Deinococcus oregonensis TaxID=1805970 RepID=A0ABV6AWN0_9DEIO